MECLEIVCCVYRQLWPSQESYWGEESDIGLKSGWAIAKRENVAWAKNAKKGLAPWELRSTYMAEAEDNKKAPIETKQQAATIKWIKLGNLQQVMRLISDSLQEVVISLLHCMSYAIEEEKARAMR